jgi:hypothetical protein
LATFADFAEADGEVSAGVGGAIAVGDEVVSL